MTQSLEEEIKELKKKLEDLAYQYGYDLGSLKGEHRVFLQEKLKPLLQDALDALEIEAYEVAKSRLKRAISLL